MALIEISIVPVGTKSSSISHYITRALGILKEIKGIKYELTPMGTIIEGNLDTLLELAKKMHKVIFNQNVKRVVTTIKIDDRQDKPLTMQGKIEAVRKKYVA